MNHTEWAFMVHSFYFYQMEKKSYTFDEIKLKLVNYCVYQDRCHAEVEQKMRDFLLIDEAKEEIIMYLIRENYLNEERYAKSYARGKFYMKQWGRIKIQLHLKQKGIVDRLISKAMTEIYEEDYNETIKKLIDKKSDGEIGRAHV